ncbi:uncharacterized protein [Macrobrachium rosenbergii]|uniref:uncharacterized protein n=1 Tax=Macrobrachium rosenbergii TaxID=79674 RepID=UPI0034D4F24B
MGIIPFLDTYIKLGNMLRGNRRNRGGPEDTGRDEQGGDADRNAPSSLTNAGPTRRRSSPDSLFNLCLQALRLPRMQAEHRYVLIHYIELYNAHRINMRLRREYASIRSEVLRLELTMSQHFTGSSLEPHRIYGASWGNHGEPTAMRHELMLTEADHNNNVPNLSHGPDQRRHFAEYNVETNSFSIDLSHFLASAAIGSELLGTEQDISHNFMDYYIDLEIVFRVNLGIFGELGATNWERLRMQLVLISRDNMQRIVVSLTLVFYVLLPEDCCTELEGMISLVDNHLLFRIRINVLHLTPHLTFYDNLPIGNSPTVQFDITTLRPLMSIPAVTAPESPLPEPPRRIRAYMRARNLMAAREQGIPPELQLISLGQQSLFAPDTPPNKGPAQSKAPVNSFGSCKREPMSCNLEYLRLRGVSLDLHDIEEEGSDEMDNNENAHRCSICGEALDPNHDDANDEASLEPAAGEELEEMQEAEEYEIRRAALANILHEFFLRLASASKNAGPPHRQP